jgi:putative redox protein
MSHEPDIRITFPGGKKVDARVGSRVISTDQPTCDGGGDSAPMPFDLFLASIGTCAGFYVLAFLESRGLSTEGVELHQRLGYDATTHVLSAVTLEIKLPTTVPEKYHAAIIRAADTCAVKKAIQQQPNFSVQVTAS